MLAETIKNQTGASVDNRGNLTATVLLQNAGTIDNRGELKAHAFENDKTVTNYASGNITVNTTFNNNAGATATNYGSILAQDINNAAGGTITNGGNGSITATNKLANAGTFNNYKNVAANEMENSGSFTNFSNGSVTVNTTLNNIGDGVIDN